MADEAQPGRLATGLMVVGLCETAALAIALLAPITPNKTGSKGSLADWFFEQPSYLQEVLVYFLLTNGLLLVLAALFVLSMRRRRDGEADDS